MVNFFKDMCINDIYLCKDFSRINCTLACSSLGYIPCKSYMDKKVCSSVLKNRDLFNGISSISEKSVISTETIVIAGMQPLGFFFFLVIIKLLLFFIVLGSSVFITMSILFVLLALFYKRFRQPRDTAQIASQLSNETASALADVINLILKKYLI